MVVVGYDKGDAYFDNPTGWKEVEDWFEKNAASVCKERGFECTLKGVQVNNVLKKPGPVFNVMAKAAYAAGANYFYRLNDDTELTSKWVDEMVGVLKGWGPPYGVVGPNHQGGNTAILTHDFVHRTHMDIFDQTYYPDELVDWWMDDWITTVYGKARTEKVASAKATHHTGSHGRRPTVSVYCSVTFSNLSPFFRL